MASHSRSPVRRAKDLALEFLGGAAVIPALINYLRDRPIPHKAWMALLRAHCVGNGRLSDMLDGTIRVLRPAQAPTDATGLLGHFTAADQRRIADAIARDGFYVFDRRMPEVLCAEIEAFALRTPAMIDGEMEQTTDRVSYEPQNPKGHLYKIREQDSAECDAIQSLMADQALLAIAETYLGTKTVVGGIDTWWSTAYGNGPSDTAAQAYHFDFDAPPRWLKLFVYVTPVNPENGPHTYVKGSHRRGLSANKELLSRGYVRIPDKEIENAFGPESCLELTGERGTTFIADTRGFHKGKHPRSGHRLISQLIYCSALFNNHAPRPPKLKNVSPALQAAMKKAASVYSRYR